VKRSLKQSMKLNENDTNYTGHNSLNALSHPKIANTRVMSPDPTQIKSRAPNIQRMPGAGKTRIKSGVAYAKNKYFLKDQPVPNQNHDYSNWMSGTALSGSMPA